MRKFNWTKINFRAVKDTFWEKVDESEIKLDTRQLEILFGMPETKKKAVIQDVSKPKTIHLLDMKRSQNMCKFETNVVFYNLRN